MKKDIARGPRGAARVGRYGPIRNAARLTRDATREATADLSADARLRKPSRTEVASRVARKRARDSRRVAETAFPTSATVRAEARQIARGRALRAAPLAPAVPGGKRLGSTRTDAAVGAPRRAPADGPTAPDTDRREGGRLRHDRATRRKQGTPVTPATVRRGGKTVKLTKNARQNRKTVRTSTSKKRGLNRKGRGVEKANIARKAARTSKQARQERLADRARGTKSGRR